MIRPANYCECGCGDVAKNGNRFINGHNNRNSKMQNSYVIDGDVTRIILNRKNGSKLMTMIDTEDLDKVKRFRNTWYASKNKMGTFYVMGDLSSGTRSKGTFKKEIHLLHRWIMNPPSDKVVDHINHDTLDNRKENLRILTISENNQNKKSSEIPGVYPYHYDKSKWVAYCSVDGKNNNLGIFKTKTLAEEAVIDFKKTHHIYSKVVGKHDVPKS